MPRNPNLPGVLIALIFFLIPLFLPAQTYPVPYRKGLFWGYANPETGQILLRPTLDSVGFFSDYAGNFPLAWVKKDNRFGLVNLLGELVLPIKETSTLPIIKVAAGFFAVERFVNGATGGRAEGWEVNVQFAPLPHPVSYFDQHGRRIGRPFEWMSMPKPGYPDESSPMDPNEFTSYPNLVIPPNFFPTIWKAGRFGLLDLRKGRVVVQPDWDNIVIQNGLAIAQRWDLGNPENGDIVKTFFINLQNGLKTELPDSIAIVNRYAQGDLILAWNKHTKLYGFLDKSGRVAIPFRYVRANPFSKNGLTKVTSSVDWQWAVIDLQGREQYVLGKNNGAKYLPDNSLWAQSDADGLYRKRSLNPEDTSEKIGLDYPPQLVKFGAASYLIAHKDGKTGLLDTNGRILLPFELDNYYSVHDATGLPQDSLVRKRLFHVKKNGRIWVFDGQDRQPVWPKLQPGNGLTLGATYDQSNFQLLVPISGDSLFQILLADTSLDILNIKTGKRWNARDAAYFRITTEGKSQRPVIYSPKEGDIPSRRYFLDGQPAPEIIAVGNTEGFGAWSMGLDHTDTTTLFDSTGRVVGRFHDPFGDNNNRPRIESNWHSTHIPFVIVIRSNEQCAVFSLEGRLLTPPGITDIFITDDFIFGSLDGKAGACAVQDGKVVLPFIYQHVNPGGDHLSGIDSAGTEHQFDLKGNFLRTYPTGYTSCSLFTDGFQVVYHGRKSAFVDEHLNLVFADDSIQQVQAFSEGLAAVRIDSLGWKYVRTNSQTAFPGYFDHTEPFENGRAIVQTPDGWTKAIDTLGHTLLQVPSNANPYLPALSPLGKNLLLRKDTANTQIITLDGRPILQHCSCVGSNYWYNYPNAPPALDTITFYCDGHLGRLLPDGRMEEVKKSEFVLRFDPRRGTRSILPRFACSVEGLMDSVTGDWIIPPKVYQEITLPADLPAIAYVADLQQGITTQHNRNTGASMLTNPARVQELEGNGGWLVLDDQAKTGLLYSPDFTSAQPWNYAYQTIQWSKYLGLFEVLDAQQKTVGYISKNGHVLFED